MMLSAIFSKTAAGIESLIVKHLWLILDPIAVGPLSSAGLGPSILVGWMAQW